MKKLSIIIPVYNSQKHLHSCLNSIIKQLNCLENTVEIITVNDCSTDNSLNILNKYNKFPFIKIIDLKKNLGVSNARNIGIANASGKYIMFLDSDDMLIKGSIKIILNYIDNTNTDIIRFTYRKYFNGIRFPKHAHHSTGIFNVEEDYDKSILETFIDYYDYNAVWGQVILAKYAKKTKFDTDLIMAEDFKYNVQLYSKVHSIFVINDPILYYRVDNSSVTHSTVLDKVLKKAISAYKGYYVMHDYDINNSHSKNIDNKIINVITSIFVPIYSSNKDEFDRVYLEFLNSVDNKIIELENVNYVKKICENKSNKQGLKKIINRVRNLFK